MQTRKDLVNCHFELIQSRYIDVNWRFDCQASMILFVKNLFGLDLASDKQVLEGIERILAVKRDNQHYKMQWALEYIQLQKT